MMNGKQDIPRNHPGLELQGPIVAGVMQNQSSAVPLHAAELAAALSVELVFAYVEIDQVLLEWDPESLRGSESLHPPVDQEMSGITAVLTRTLQELLVDIPVEWSFRVLGGDTAHALTRLADEVGAQMIVVGTRRRGLGHQLEELVSGSVAVRLAHSQWRPVVVVPFVGELRGE